MTALGTGLLYYSRHMHQGTSRFVAKDQSTQNPGLPLFSLVGLSHDTNLKWRMRDTMMMSSTCHQYFDSPDPAELEPTDASRFLSH